VARRAASKPFRLLAVAGMTTVLVAGGHGVRAEDQVEWQFQLQYQIAVDEQCQIEYMTNVRETEVGGVDTVSGRAVCSDGRAFDFARLDPASPFDIKSCEVQAC
jgi:hypothetical protein